MIIAVDFDGTCVTHEYPKVGRDIGAQPILEQLVKDGHKLILWTMRSGITLEEAVRWFTQNNIALFGINKNPEQLVWTNSAKAYANLYIDDAAYGAPLVHLPDERPYFDWTKFSVASAKGLPT